MATQETLVSKKRGPAATGQGTPVMVRLHPVLLAKVDTWAERHNVTRPQAIRAMLEALVQMGGLDDA